jgi:3-phosphoshikimate 1-carboxyvinyltransferase
VIATISPPKQFRGTLEIPGDKSISHRAAILGALAQGETEVEGFLEAEDCRSTLHCLEALGVALEQQGAGHLRIRGRGKRLREPEGILDAGNSGTTARLLLGLLAGQPFPATVTGDPSLRARPMLRVVEPLRRMGARVEGEGRRLPITIRGGDLHGVEHRLPVASAQIKSALLLAGLYARGVTVVEEPQPSRNHTELMLKQMGAPVEMDGCRVAIAGGGALKGGRIRIPGDISAAAFFMVAAALLPGAEVYLPGIGVNPTRSGVIDVLQEMGAEIAILNRRRYGEEPVADLLVRGGAPLRGTEIGGELVPRLIDELPVLAVAAALARGRTEIRDAGELRVKESDRLAALARELSRLGVSLRERPDGMVIQGGRPLTGAVVESHGDHRIAMALAVAGLAAAGKTIIRGAEAIKVSFPCFFQALRRLGGEPGFVDTPGGAC